MLNRDLAKAITLYQDTLAARERVLGPDHPDTLSSRNNLAGAYQSAGDLATAIPLYHRTRSPPASGCSAKSIQSAGPFGSI